MSFVGEGQSILVIRLDEPEATCIVCGADATGLRLALPMYEDLILPNSWHGDWAGFSACRRCFDHQKHLTVPRTTASFRHHIVWEGIE